ncbi:hypothetical protein HPB50_028046 [Hyalomma asiaticum]|nr:hypothetical protein HPB50_028046 [Hyalomma asiaticum]
MPYEGGYFHFLIKCPPDYPNSSPRVRLMTTAAGGSRFGPRFYQNAKLCLGCLGSLYDSPWSADQYPLNLMFIINFLQTAEKPFSEWSAFGVLSTFGTWLSDKISTLIIYIAVLRHKTTMALCVKWSKNAFW